MVHVFFLASRCSVNLTAESCASFAERETVWRFETPIGLNRGFRAELTTFGFGVETMKCVEEILCCGDDGHWRCCDRGTDSL